MSFCVPGPSLGVLAACSSGQNLACLVLESYCVTLERARMIVFVAVNIEKDWIVLLNNW